MPPLKLLSPISIIILSIISSVMVIDNFVIFTVLYNLKVIIIELVVVLLIISQEVSFLKFSILCF